MTIAWYEWRYYYFAGTRHVYKHWLDVEKLAKEETFVRFCLLCDEGKGKEEFKKKYITR